MLAIADIDLAAAQQTAGQFCIPVAVDDAAAVLANNEIDAVLICASTDTHARLTIEAAQAGKHIFCEKPIAHDLAEIDAVLAAVAQAGVKLQIGFNRRFDANFARVRQAIVAGEIGAPRCCTSPAAIPARRPSPTSRYPAVCSWT